MASAFQNRIVGTIIVVALAVIFLPDFLGGKKVSQEQSFENVPAAPDKKPIVDPEPFPTDRVAKTTQRPVDVVDEEPLDEKVIKAVSLEPEEDKKADELASQTIVDTPDEAEDGGWVIQLGSFRHQKNVKQLINKLESSGYRVFSRPIKTNSGPLTKVFIGPDLNKEKLESAIPHLQELTGLKGKVTSFKVD